MSSSWARPIVTYTRFSDNVPQTLALNSSDLIALLTTFEVGCSVASCIGKNCAAKSARECWSPISVLKGARRGKSAVTGVNFLVFDLDHLKAGLIDEVRVAIAEYEYVLHTAHSHTPDDESYRLIFPISRPMTAAEFDFAWRGVVDALNLPADRACADLPRIFALPTAREGITPFAEHHEGETIDIDDALAAAGHAVVTSIPIPEKILPAEPINLGDVRSKLSEVRRSKAHGDAHRKEQSEILGRVLDGRPLAEPGARGSTLLRVVGMIVYALPAGTPFEAVFEILRPSLSSMDSAPQGLESWFALAKEDYERQVKCRTAADAKKAIFDAAIEKVVQGVKERSMPKADEIESAGGVWEDMVILKKSELRVCEFNAELILTCAPETREVFRWNDVLKQVEIVGGPFADVPPTCLEGTVAGWLQRHYDFFGSSALVGPAILRTARKNIYDPLAEYLGEIAWDGISRIDSFLEVYLGVVEGDPRYVSAVSRRWLISLVARALRPGCKVDTVLILEGEQGVGKSTALESLVTGPYYLDTALAMGEKDAMQVIASAWLVELGELASFKRAENGRIRQFISSKIDKYRPPYGRGPEDSPRRCVFVGTTNDEHYLTDRTGNRRYWPVRVGQIDTEAITRDRDLILAEAVVAFNANERWYLKDEEISLAAQEAEDRVDVSTYQEVIERWWYGLQPSRRPRMLNMSDVIEMALQITSIERITQGIRTEIGIAMRCLGFIYKKRLAGGSRVRVYEPSRKMLEAPVRTSNARAANLALVKSVIHKETK